MNKRITAKKKDLDAPPGEAPVKECPECEEMVYASARTCPYCDFVFPEREIPHGATATELSPLAGLNTGIVSNVFYTMHPGRDGKAPTIKAEYELRGMKSVVLWLSCSPNAHAFAHGKWKEWLRVQITTEEIPDYREGREWLAWLRRCVKHPTKITFKIDDSKYPDIVGYTHET